MTIDELNDEVLMHYGVGWDANPPGIGSGRYPHGSGENPGQHGNKSLADFKSELMKKGFTEKEVAEYLGYKSTTELRRQISIDKERRMTDMSLKVREMKAQGMSNVAIAEKLGTSDTNVGKILREEQVRQSKKTQNVVDTLKKELETKHYIDTSAGAELECGVSKTRMTTAVQMLKEEGYQTYYIQVPQPSGKYTTIRVLGTPDSDWNELVHDHTLIQPIQSYFQDDGSTVLGIQPVKSVDSSRVLIRYGNEQPVAGKEREGVIQLKRGVEDISLNGSAYSQVRIGVDGTHYMKGMAIYADDKDFPPGIDIIYNTNKSLGTDKYEVFKKMNTIKDESGNTVVNQDNPFGASIKDLSAGGQRYYIDEKGEKQLSCINKVNDEGDWDKWHRTISAQYLSKQPEATVRKQLDLTLQDRRAEYDEIMSLTNPTLKRKMLDSFADDCDASASHLKAKAFPRQAAQVIVAVPSMADNEVFAPNYENGEWVALVRFPFASYHESPKLRVNNNNPEALKVIGKNAPDAIGINAHVMAQMSGADSDGDTALVIPLKTANVRTGKVLPGLEGFSTDQYKIAEKDKDTIPVITPQMKQVEMGKITNLIADMQLKGCEDSELERAIKHSMVVVDAEKHKLDYKKSEADNNIDGLKRKYQDKGNGKYGGSSTLITRANSEVYVNERKPGTVVDEETGASYYAIDPRTGKKIWVDTGKTYMKKVKAPTKADPDRVKYKETLRQEKTTAMEQTDDATTLLSSKTNASPIERAYADYANDLKALANEARKQMLATPKLKRDPQAAKEYASEVETLKAKNREAKLNAPRERQALIMAEATYKEALAKNPEMNNDKAFCKKLKGQAITRARIVNNAKKPYVSFTDREWEAVQKGAISDNLLSELLVNAKDDEVKQRAMPKTSKKVSDSMASLARSMATNGYTSAEIANRLGVSTSTVYNILKD